MKYMKEYLNNLKELKPILTDIQPQINPLDNIRIILFDIYGTLLISSSGDIDTSDFRERSIHNCFKSLGIKVEDHAVHDLSETVRNEYVDGIERFQRRMKEEGHPYPEVDITGVWKDVIEKLNDSGIIKVKGKVGYRKLAFIFELTHNKVYPMPKMNETLRYFYDKNFPLGIVSNAQFYTPITLNYFLTNEVRDAEEVALFDPDLTFFSYTYLRGKPDTFLFDQAKNACNRIGVDAEQVVFIGNDMLKDIWTAKQAGFKTILFAGDKRSLRLREGDERVRSIKPDAVITSLNQLPQIIK